MIQTFRHQGPQGQSQGPPADCSVGCASALGPDARLCSAPGCFKEKWRNAGSIWDLSVGFLWGYRRKHLATIDVVVSWHMGTPSYHPFLDGMFPQKNHPAMEVALFYGNLHMRNAGCMGIYPRYSSSSVSRSVFLLYMVMAQYPRPRMVP